MGCSLTLLSSAANRFYIVAALEAQIYLPPVLPQCLLYTAWHQGLHIIAAGLSPS